jgi:hypothetical protein
MATTAEGKAISRRNAFKHGAKSAETCAVRTWLKEIRALARQMQCPHIATGGNINGGTFKEYDHE